MKKALILIVSVMMLMTFMSCEELSTTGDVYVYNSTSSTIIVDVNDGDGNWISERTVYSGGSTIYSNVEEGTIYGSARFSGYSTWYTSSARYLTAGSSVSITWSPTNKAAEISPGLQAIIE